MKAKKLPSGRWRCRVYDGTDPAGKKIYKSFTADSKKEAELLAAQYAASRKSTVSKDRTLADAYARYIEIKKNTLSPATVREYSRAAKADFPELMPLRLSRLTKLPIRTS